MFKQSLLRYNLTKKGKKTMSTRATYLFKDATGNSADVCVYVHHDGYPVGAAAKLADTLETEGSSHRLPEAFIRANAGAEITGGHDSHGDTEYQYTISFSPRKTKANLLVLKRDTNPIIVIDPQLGGVWGWNSIYNGDLESFIYDKALAMNSINKQHRDKGESSN